ncbi:hypothetical protein Hanom_Chr10g00938681 [Helianthus anomalus]
MWEERRKVRGIPLTPGYVVVSDSLEGLAPTVVRRPKPEPRDTVDIPPLNPDDPIDLESSPERLLRKKAR